MNNMEYTWKPLAERKLEGAYISEDPPYRIWSIPINNGEFAAKALADVDIKTRKRSYLPKPNQPTTR